MPAKPVFQPTPGMTQWLREALGSRFEAVRSVGRTEPRPEILREIVQALHYKQPVRFQYQPRQGDRATRIVSPHVIIAAVGRLHLRGWDHDRSAPRDFVLSRIIAIGEVSDDYRYVDQVDDTDWSEHVDIEVRLRDGEILAAVRPYYDLDEFGRRSIKVRKAHLPYLIGESKTEQRAHFVAPVTVRVATIDKRMTQNPHSQDRTKSKSPRELKR